MFWGAKLVVEGRYMMPLIEGMQSDGLEVSEI
jgi:hypothetical protein